MSCFYASACLRVCSLVSCWSVVFGSRHSCLEFQFCVGVRTLALHVLPCCVIVRSKVRSAVRSSVHVCCVLCCCTQFVFLSAACIHVMSCAVWYAAYVFHWPRAFMLSCLVWIVFSLAACSCPVLHMAGDFVLLAMCLFFVLCEHMAFVLVFCVPCLSP